MKRWRIFFFGMAIALGACTARTTEQTARYTFPQGVASGDPQPNAVTLWTRVVNQTGEPAPIDLTVEISITPSFEEIVQTTDLQAFPKDDYTIRYYASNLKSGKRYYYRFVAGDDISLTGRTMTAPNIHRVAPLKFATLACSSYEQGFFGTLARMIKEDEAKPEDEQLEVVFHLGDFIYEVVGDDPAVVPPYPPKWLVDHKGGERTIPPFPDGLQRQDTGHSKSGSWYPFTVDDYRLLYKTYLSNPVMIAARARWPFIVTWDDHEFADGNHQSYMPATEALGKPGMQTAKVASNQAWFEYIPAALTNATRLPNIHQAAHDFEPVEVENVPLGAAKTYGLYSEPNNRKAISSMCIYRALQWGKDILIVITDTKSYQEPGVSVLGRQQKMWFKNLLSLNTKWKLWANSEPILAAKVDFDNIEDSGKDRQLVYNDSWKQARNEREELLQFMDDQQITGVVSLSGDYHIQVASSVATSSGREVMADFAVTSMSAHADFYWLERRAQGYQNPILYSLFAYTSESGGQMPNINTTVMYGAEAARQLALNGSVDEAMAAMDLAINPGIQYFDCEHNGYLTGALVEDVLEVEFTNTENARMDYEADGAPIVSKVAFELPLWKAGELELKRTMASGEIFPGFW